MKEARRAVLGAKHERKWWRLELRQKSERTRSEVDLELGLDAGCGRYLA